MYFDFNKIPEAEGLTKDQVKTVAKASTPKAFKTPLGMTGIAILAICVFVGLTILPGMIGGALGGAVGGGLMQVFLVNAARPAFAQERQSLYPSNPT